MHALAFDPGSWALDGNEKSKADRTGAALWGADGLVWSTQGSVWDVLDDALAAVRSRPVAYVFVEADGGTWRQNAQAAAKLNRVIGIIWGRLASELGTPILEVEPASTWRSGLGWPSMVAGPRGKRRKKRDDWKSDALRFARAHAELFDEELNRADAICMACHAWDRWLELRERGADV